MFNSLRIPHYFSSALSREIDELYASAAIANFALAVVMIFEPIFLYSVLKFTVQEVLLFFAAVYACYVLFIPFGAKVVSRYGYAHGILFNIPFQVLFWFFLFGSQENIAFIYIAPIIFAIQKALYWPAFHASVARFAREGQIGREFSMMKAIINLAFILGPILGGLISERFGVRMLFVLASSIYTLSFIPVFLHKEIFIPKIYQFADTWKLYKMFPKKFLAYFGFGEELLVLTIWPIFIYVAVQDYADTGKLVTIATLVATLLVLGVGKLTDEWSKQKLARFGTWVYALVWFMRLCAKGFWGVFTVDMLSRTIKDVVFVPLSTLTYERAESTHIMPYVVFFEQTLALAKFLAAVVGIIVFGFIASMFGQLAGFYSLFILGALFTLLYAYI